MRLTESSWKSFYRKMGGFSRAWRVVKWATLFQFFKCRRRQEERGKLRFPLSSRHPPHSLPSDAASTPRGTGMRGVQGVKGLALAGRAGPPVPGPHLPARRTGPLGWMNKSNSRIAGKSFSEEGGETAPLQEYGERG